MTSVLRVSAFFLTFRLDLCELLINYVQNLIPKNAASAPAEEKKELSQQVQDDWKKQKFIVLTSRKEQDNDFFSSKGNGKKKRDNKKKEEEPAAVEKQALQHQFEVMGYFEKLKVPPPMLVGKLEETLKLLVEKKNYYSGLPLEEPKKEEDRKEESEEKKPEHKKHEVRF